MGALEEVKDLAEKVARRRGVDLWDVALEGGPSGSILRVYVDAEPPQRVDLETIAQISEEISRGLDLTDPIPGRYTLEVSSPGLERNLRLPRHFTRAVGSKVVVKTKQQLVDKTNRLEGSIKAANDTAVRIDLGAEEVAVPYDEIKMARTVFDWS